MSHNQIGSINGEPLCEHGIWTPNTCRQCTIADLTRERDEARAERDALSDGVDLLAGQMREIDHAICWNVDCVHVSHILDTSYDDMVRIEESIAERDAAQDAERAAILRAEAAERMSGGQFNEIANLVEEVEEALADNAALLEMFGHSESCSVEDFESERGCDCWRSQPHPGQALLARLSAAEEVAGFHAHLQDCSIAPCTCGLTAALAAWEEGQK